MEIAQEYEDEVEHLLKKHPDGLSFDAIYDKAKGISERTDLSRVMHLLVQRMTVYKANGVYKLTLGQDHYVAPAPQQVSTPVENVEYFEKPKTPVSQPAPIAAAPKAKEVPQPTQRKPRGTLRRTSAKGRVAMVLYAYRDEDYYLPISRIKDATGDTGPGSMVNQALGALILDGYLVKHGEMRSVCYKWANNHCYPFADIGKNDEAIVLVKPKSQREEPLGLVGAKPEPTTVQPAIAREVYPERSCTVHVADLYKDVKLPEGIPSQEITLNTTGPSLIDILDAAIATQESSLSMLRLMRETVKSNHLRTS